MSYIYCGERMGSGFFGIYRMNRENHVAEMFFAEENEWRPCLEATEAFNGEIFTSTISEEEALAIAKRRAINARAMRAREAGDID